MKHRSIFSKCCFFFIIVTSSNAGFCQNRDTILISNKVTLNEAHIGDLETDTKLLDSYKMLPNNIRQFYFDARAVFSKTRDTDFSNPEISYAAKKHGIALMGGPMLGNLKEDGLVIWLRPSTSSPIAIKVSRSDGEYVKYFVKDSIEPGVEQQFIIDGLISDTYYKYSISIENQKIAHGNFKTAAFPDEQTQFRLVFGSCFHKIGLHNPNLVNQIVNREPHAMALLGDIAVDDRENKINMHRSDYLLRDVSTSWQRLTANVPIYSVWDDHDYLNNDLSGIPDRFTKADREALREVWRQNWNNPLNESEGIYFNARIGPLELIMLDTRSCRQVEKRGQYSSYLGKQQQEWLKDILLKSTAPYKVISSGTMWSDNVSEGKDSWGTWDTLARQEIFNLIETENISGVLFISGDRHGARGFKITRPSGYNLYEFEAASLGGVPGPVAIVKDSENQIFGYKGTDVIAFGEFTFDTRKEEPFVIFRLIDEFGNILEEHSLSYSQLSPG